MSKRLFGNYYYSMENSFYTKREAQTAAGKLKSTGKYFVRVARTGWGNLKGLTRKPHVWAVFIRRK